MIKNRLRKNKQKGNTLVLIILIVSIILAVFILTKIKATNTEVAIQQNNSREQFKDYRSKGLHLSISVPQNFNIEERFTTLILKKGSGEVIIDRNGTNFESLEDYIEDLSKKNNFILSNKNEQNINGFIAVSGNIQNEKIYFIYNNFAIYSLTTKDETLYDDLDQIAKSFKYIP